ncbi:ABC transporter substrate binding protein [Rhodoferax sp. TBRC 17660]|uniref:ABC transporter substrate binding protein n=1 Tax=Rhodoferax potami TaxID=3068338 RepID=A0ABU3KR01_9BURK|nr:ABC transporter substrate binding protein [Rhodoferax sp. TBRC 17660]MDT7520230.1 ABC transporter substrate binding protein [Rhodoferax sp. TBRC 17660]
MGLRAIHFIVGWVLSISVFAQVQAADLVIVSSEKTAGHVETAQTIALEFTRAYPERAQPSISYLSDSRLQEAELLQGARVVMTLGSDALASVLALDVRIPVVASLIPRAGMERILREAPSKSQASVSAVYLDQPFSRQVELMRLALPNTRRVGVLFGSESSQQSPTLQSALQSKGMELVSGYIGGSGTLFSALKAVLDDTDVLLAVPDSKVYNGSTISNVLLATYRARVPVIAFSPAYVRAGALMSLHSTPRQIGIQAFAIAKTHLTGNTGISLQYPTDFTVVLNEQVARSLDLVLDERSLTERLKRSERRP